MLFTYRNPFIARLAWLFVNPFTLMMPRKGNKPDGPIAISSIKTVPVPERVPAVIVKLLLPAIAPFTVTDPRGAFTVTSESSVTVIPGGIKILYPSVMFNPGPLPPHVAAFDQLPLADAIKEDADDVKLIPNKKMIIRNVGFGENKLGFMVLRFNYY
jgi:hypothetical protein